MNEQLREQIVNKFKECKAKAIEFYHIDFPKAEIKYDLTGVVAGYYQQKEGKHYFRINLDLAEQNLNDYLSETIPHEFSHFVAHVKYGNKISPHGYEWQSVMLRCFNLQPNRCHNYDVSKVKNTYKIVRHYYKCTCGYETHVSSTIHNRIQDKSRSYVFAKCHHKITPEQYQRSEEH